MAVGYFLVGSIRYVALSGNCIFLCAYMCSIKTSNGPFPMVLLSSMIYYIASQTSLLIRMFMVQFASTFLYVMSMTYSYVCPSMFGHFCCVCLVDSFLL